MIVGVRDISSSFCNYIHGSLPGIVNIVNHVPLISLVRREVKERLLRHGGDMHFVFG